MTVNGRIDEEVVRELSARHANLFYICYCSQDISGMHIALTAFAHTLHALNLWSIKQRLLSDIKGYILEEGFPVGEQKALDWLLSHYLELNNDHDESILLRWYQDIDDEWVLRRKLRQMFPEKSSSELTFFIAAEQNKSIA